jgi:uncharacterized protein YjbJ (UPF0337 family)
LTAGHLKEATVDKEHLKGAADKAKGAIKEAVGKAMGDKKLQTEGKMDGGVRANSRLSPAVLASAHE